MANGPDAGGGASCVGALAAAAAAGGAAVADAAGVGGATGAGARRGRGGGPAAAVAVFGGEDGDEPKVERPDQRQEQRESDPRADPAGRRRRRIDDSAVRQFDDVAAHVLARRQRLLVGARAAPRLRRSGGRARCGVPPNCWLVASSEATSLAASCSAARAAFRSRSLAERMRLISASICACTDCNCARVVR